MAQAFELPHVSGPVLRSVCRSRDGSGARARGGFTLIEIMIVLAVIAILVAIAIPNLLASKIATNEAATCGCLKTFLTSEYQFYKKKDYFAPSALQLLKYNLVALDSANSFMNHDDDGDVGSAPKAGYFYEVLHGDSNGQTSWYINNSSGLTAQMITWAATSRAAEPYQTGGNQYFISESGSLYRNDEPVQGDPLYKQFRLDVAITPPVTSWRPAR